MDGARDYRLMSRQMVDAVLSMREYNRFSKGIFGWVGFRTKWLPYVNTQRVAGETKWNFFSLFLYSIDGIVAFSTVPLSIASVMGILFCLLALVGIVFIVIRTLMFGDPVLSRFLRTFRQPHRPALRYGYPSSSVTSR